MTTTAFTPSPLAPFQFQAVLDGDSYNVVVTWNVFGQRWYLSVYNQTGTLIVSQAMVASPAAYPISLVGGYFTSRLVYLEGLQVFEVTP